jgi:hypothetical protein
MNLVAAIILATVAILITIDVTERYDCATFHIEKACTAVQAHYNKEAKP